MHSRSPKSLEPLRGALQALEEAGRPTPSTPCLNTDVLAALASEGLPPGLRLAALSHLAECGDCRSTTASLARALADTTVSGAIAALSSPADRGGRRRFSVVVPAAAAAAVFVALWAGGGTPRSPLHRSPAITAADTPVPIAPLGTGRRAGALRWGAVPGVDRYRVTLFDAVGQLVFEAELQDTLVTLPDSIELRPGQAYFWKVEGRTGWDRWTASPLFEFSVEREREP